MEVWEDYFPLQLGEIGFHVNFPTCMINERNGVVVCLGSTVGFCWGRFSLAKDFHGGILKHDPFLGGSDLMQM